jgi:hypothetical protein
MDGSPVVAITDQVPRAMIGRDAFRETDIINVPADHEAQRRSRRHRTGPSCARFRGCHEGRPGPVLIDAQMSRTSGDWSRGRGGGRMANPRSAHRGRRTAGSSSSLRSGASAPHGRTRRDARQAYERCLPSPRHRHPGGHYPARHQRISEVTAFGHAGYGEASTARSSTPTSSASARFDDQVTGNRRDSLPAPGHSHRTDPSRSGRTFPLPGPGRRCQGYASACRPSAVAVKPGARKSRLHPGAL